MHKQFARKVGTSANSALICYYLLRLKLSSSTRAASERIASTLKQPASFRWLSLGAAVKAVWEVYPALWQELEHEASIKAGGADQAKEILQNIKSVQFLLTTNSISHGRDASIRQIIKVFPGKQSGY